MRTATKQERALLLKIFRQSEEISQLAKARERAFQDLKLKSKGRSIKAKIGEETRVYKVGRPVGKFVYFSRMGFIVNRKA